MLQIASQEHHWRINPSISWLRVDDERIQVRFPDEQHVTFDKYSEYVENLLFKCRAPQDLSALLSEYNEEDQAILSSIIEYMQSANVLINDDDPPASTALAIINHYSRKTLAGRSNLKIPVFSDVSVIGSGVVFEIVCNVVQDLGIGTGDIDAGKKSVENSRKSPDAPSLKIFCSDDENISMMRGLNQTALDTGEFLSFVYWDGARLNLGPFVAPGQSACFECYVARRYANSSFRDELNALLESLPQGASQKIKQDMIFSGLVSFAVGRHIALLREGVFDIERSGQITSWDLLTGEMTTGKVLKVSACKACGSSLERDPLRSLRKL